MKRHLLISISMVLSCMAWSQFKATNGPLVPLESKYMWASGDTAFVAFEENLYRTFNGGGSWDLLLNGLPIEVDPRTIAVANNMVFIGTNNFARVYSSSDWGETWDDEIVGATALWVPTHSTSNGSVLLMGGTTFPPHIYDFTNQKWVDAGLSGTTHGLSFQQDGSIIANVGSVSSGNTFISEDNGKTWTQIEKEPAFLPTRCYHQIKLGNRIITSVNLNGYAPHYSDDGGKTWTASSGVKSYNLDPYANRFFLTNDGSILYNNNGILFESKDSGTTWNGLQIYIGTNAVTWKSNHLLSTAGDFSSFGKGQQTDIQVEGSISTLLGHNPLVTAANNQLWFYENQKWSSDTVLAKNLFNPEVRAIWSVNEKLYVAIDRYLFEWNNGEEMTESIGDHFNNAQLYYFGEVDNRYFVSTVPTRANLPPEIYYSDDLKSWTKSTFTNNVGFGPNGTSNYVEHIQVHGSSLLADLSGGLAISNDGGGSWKWQGGSNSGNVYSIDNILYRFSDPQFSNPTLERSSDNGKTWTKTFDGLPGYTGQSDFSNFNNIYLIGSKLITYAQDNQDKRSFYILNNNKWEIHSSANGLPDLPILNMMEHNGQWFIGVKGGGVYFKDDSVNSISVLRDQEVHTFPNPVKDILHLHTNQVILSIKIYSSTGGLVESVVGSNQINLTSLAPGYYILQVRSTSGTSAMKIIKQ